MQDQICDMSVKTSLRVQEIRKKLLPHLKAAKDEKKKSTMVSDHLLINRKKFILDESNNLQQKAQEVGRPLNEKNQCTVKGDYIAKGNTTTQTLVTLTESSVFGTRFDSSVTGGNRGYARECSAEQNSSDWKSLCTVQMPHEDIGRAEGLVCAQVVS